MVIEFDSLFNSKAGKSSRNLPGLIFNTVGIRPFVVKLFNLIIAITLSYLVAAPVFHGYNLATF